MEKYPSCWYEQEQVKRGINMFRGSLSIGKVFGISIRLHYSWLVIFALVTWAMAASYFPSMYPSWSLSMKIGAGLVTSLLFFGSVLAHELMHSIVALHEGIHIRSITLFILGGVSQMVGEPKTPQDEFRMAIAGPLTSFILGGIFLGIFIALRNMTSTTAQFMIAISYWLGYINIALGVFNLIPGFPLDGGRVFRSLLWWRSRNLQSATRIATAIGRGVGFAFIFGGVWLIFTSNWLNGIWLALIGWFLESAAVGSYRQMLLQDMLKGHVASEVMSRDCIVLSPDTTIEQLVNENILTTGRRCFPVVTNSRVVGLVTIHNIRAIPRELWNIRTVEEVMTPLENIKSVRLDENLFSVLQILIENDINQIPVVEDHSVVGLIGRDNILSFIDVRSQLRV
jgi:Zn-dependent protease/predicted transcriptional regulator